MTPGDICEMDIAKLIYVFFQGLYDVTGHQLHMINVIQNFNLVRSDLPGELKSRFGIFKKIVLMRPGLTQSSIQRFKDKCYILLFRKRSNTFKNLVHIQKLDFITERLANLLCASVLIQGIGVNHKITAMNLLGLFYRFLQKIDIQAVLVGIDQGILVISREGSDFYA